MVEKSDNFLDPSKVTVTTLLLLAGTDVDESEYTVAREFVVKEMNDTTIPPEDGKWTIANTQAMPTVVTAYTLALTFGASTAMCEN